MSKKPKAPVADGDGADGHVIVGEVLNGIYDSVAEGGAGLVGLVTPTAHYIDGEHGNILVRLGAKDGPVVAKYKTARHALADFPKLCIHHQKG